jgi:spore coat protein U-like protein
MEKTMKRLPKILVAVAVVGAVVVAGDSKVMAATSTGTIAVSATVVKNCVLSNGAIAFGNYDTLSGTNIDVTSGATVTVSCTKGVAYSVSLDLGANVTGTTRRMKDPAGDFLNYEIYSDSARTTVWNATNLVSGSAASKAAITLTAYGRLPAGQDVPVGVYADTVNSTVTF